MGKEQDQGRSYGIISNETKENLKKWGIRLGLVAIAILGLAWIL